MTIGRALLPTLAAATLAGCVPSLDCDGCLAPVGAWTSPSNSWSLAEPPSDLVGGTFANGQTAPDLRALDQFADELSLWQFYGDVILLDVSTMWCGPCQELRVSTEATHQHFKDQGFTYLTVIQQTETESEPVPEDLVTWAEAGLAEEQVITAPIVADPNGRLGSASAVINNQFPALLLIDREMNVVRRIEQPEAEAVDAAIEAMLAGE